jgi:hydrogenase nickel incorporation protein HypB
MTTIQVITNILQANDRIADQNAEIFAASRLFVLNLMSSPGAGKTSLLERTIDALGPEVRVGVIEGDIQSSVDAERLAKKGVQAVQINTGGACHLDGNMIRDALPALTLGELDLLVVENVGNLVCPAEFRLGEDKKAMILSVAEGDDKPLKYPLMFQESAALVINKVDLLPYVDCSVERIRERALRLNPKLSIFELSCRTGEGIRGFADWLGAEIKNKRRHAA